MAINKISLVEFHDIDLSSKLCIITSEFHDGGCYDNNFFGHKSIYKEEQLYKKIENTILENSLDKEEVLFYCGGYGDFDNMCASVCRSIKQSLHCEIIFVTPYISESQQRNIKYLIDNHLYDSALYPPLENVPPKLAIIKRNQWMIDESDLIIAYVHHSYGGAYKSLMYATKKNKCIINLAEEK